MGKNISPWKLTSLTWRGGLTEDKLTIERYIKRVGPSAVGILSSDATLIKNNEFSEDEYCNYSIVLYKREIYR